jgi:hypothetical protein
MALYDTDGISFNVDNFKGNFAKGGARPNIFRVEVDISGMGIGNVSTAARAIDANSKFVFTCRAASIPAMTLGTIEVPYFGRKVKVAGDRTFAEWTVTVINDEDWAVRRGFELWNNLINTHVTNLRQEPYNITPVSATSQTITAYKRRAAVVQYDKSGNELQQYTLEGAFPSEVAAIDLAWDTTDTIEEFTVTLQYDYFTANKGVSVRNAGNGVKTSGDVVV